MMRFLFLLFVVGLVFAAPPSPGMQVYGDVQGVLDGTVIRVITDSNTYRVWVVDGSYGYPPNTLIIEGKEANIFVDRAFYREITIESGTLLKLDIDARGLEFCGNRVCEEIENAENCTLDCSPPAGPVAPPISPQIIAQQSWSGDWWNITLFNLDLNTMLQTSEESGSCPALEYAFNYLNVRVEGNYSGARIVIVIPKRWFMENDRNEGDVHAYWCDGRRWEEIGFTREDTGGSYSFTIETNHFSVYAIVALPFKQRTVVEENQVSQEIIGETNEIKEEQTRGQETQTLTGFFGLGNVAPWIGALVVLGLLGYYLYRRR